MPLSEQFETVQNQARQAAIAERSEYPEQTVPLTEITPMKITLEIYLSLINLKQTVVKEQLEMVHVMDNVLQPSIVCLFTEDLDPIIDTVAYMPSQQAIDTH